MMRRLATISRATSVRLTTRSTLLVASLISAWGCGGEEGTRTDGNNNMSYDACEESRSLDKVMIADFEEAPAVAFTSSNDMTPGAVFTAGLVTEALEAPKCPDDAAAGSAYHFVGTGFQSYGYSFGFNALNALPNAGGATYFNAEGWTGMSMWVRKGTQIPVSSSSIFASVAERFTAPSGSPLFSGEEMDELLEANFCPADQTMGGRCYCAFNAADFDGNGVGDTAEALRSQCDRFGAGVGIATDWRFFKIPFTRMRQRAYGRPAPTPVPDPMLLGVEIGLDGENWDFWLDELAFYREPDGGTN
jgi:hypothetical protein